MNVFEDKLIAVSLDFKDGTAHVHENAHGALPIASGILEQMHSSCSKGSLRLVEAKRRNNNVPPGKRGRLKISGTFATRGRCNATQQNPAGASSDLSAGSNLCPGVRLRMLQADTPQLSLALVPLQNLDDRSLRMFSKSCRCNTAGFSSSSNFMGK